MLGLAHRGWSLNDYSHHIVHTPARRRLPLGADRRAAHLEAARHDRLRPGHQDRHQPRRRRRAGDGRPAPRPAAPSRSSCRSGSSRPTASSSSRCTATSTTSGLRPTSRTRPRRGATWPSFVASARSLDRGVGAVLDALERYGLAANTLVICTTDHGIAFPGAKATMTDRGHRRDADHARAGRLHGRQGERRAGLAHRPLPDDLRSARHRPSRTGCRASRCCRS